MALAHALLKWRRVVQVIHRGFIELRLSVIVKVGPLARNIATKWPDKPLSIDKLRNLRLASKKIS
jgi:hypothetical protein